MANLDDLYDVENRYRAFEDHKQGILVSIAGPGTGKTFSFLRRIRTLQGEKKIAPSSLAYLTFNREISKSFVKDFEEEFSPLIPRNKRPRISTLHSFACRLIRNRGFSIGYDGSLYFTSIATAKSTASMTFCTDLVPYVSNLSFTTPAKTRKALEIIKETWQNNELPEHLDDPTPRLLEVTLQLARAYRLIDWDQAIPLAHDLFNNPDNRQRWITQIEHYLIDEFQDFNRSEQSFILSLAPTVKSMVVVGDDCQSIYSGRGASPDGILDLYTSEHHDRVSLQICRRSYSEILQHINALLSILRPDAHPMLPYHEGGNIDCFRFKSSKAEKTFLIDYLNSCIDEIPPEPRSKDGIVCLFPSWRALDFYFEQLREFVPCYLRGSHESDRRDWLTLVMQLYCQPYQRFVERLILDTFPEIKPRHKRSIVQCVLENDSSPSEAVTSLLAEGNFTDHVADGATRFLNLCEQLSSRNINTISEILSRILQIDIDDSLHELEGFSDEIADTDQDNAISGLCDRLLPETALPPEDLRAVLFLTMHSSKGLTKRVVVMPGLEDAWLPGPASVEDLAERARLFYVALSRATHQVQITYPRYRAQKDPLNFNIQGRGEVARFVLDSQIPDIYHP